MTEAIDTENIVLRNIRLNDRMERPIVWANPIGRFLNNPAPALTAIILYERMKVNPVHPLKII
ncbi:MAG: hypothetical protein OEV28_11835 [Nitrospirota bacterium]|nr:hypothetical protein [Nitrospirota bacterium]